MCVSPSRLWINWARNKYSITLCTWIVPNRYWPTITNKLSDPYYVADSTLTFLCSLQITWSMVITTAQHSAFPAAIAPSPYVFVTKFIWKDYISVANWDHNTPHLPNITLAINLSSVCVLDYLLIPAFNLSLWYFNNLEAWLYTTLTLSLVFHNSEVQISVRGVLYSFPHPVLL